MSQTDCNQHLHTNYLTQWCQTLRRNHIGGVIVNVFVSVESGISLAQEEHNFADKVGGAVV